MTNETETVDIIRIERSEKSDSFFSIKEGESVTLKNTNGKVTIIDASIERAIKLPPRYMVSVTGGRAPNTVHDSLEAARTEAHRLAKLGSNAGLVVSILQIVEEYRAEVEVKPYIREKKQ